MNETSAKIITLDSELKNHFKQFEKIMASMIDAYIVVDNNENIVRFNNLFAAMVNLNSRKILKSPNINDLFLLHINDKPLLFKDILAHNTNQRYDEVTVFLGSGKKLNVIIGYHPLTVEGRKIGAFLLLRDVTAEKNLQHKFKDTHIKAITDPLTGLYTRNYFDEYLELQEKALSNLPSDSELRFLSIVLCDIDHFKNVNDIHGHQAGDYVLAEVASAMKKSFRLSDVPCRYGGEEFLVILPGTHLEGGIIAAENFRKQIDKLDLFFDGVKIPITISCGVSEFNANNEDYVSTIARADAALYHSKKNGRNLVSLHNGDQVESHE